MSRVGAAADAEPSKSEQVTYLPAEGAALCHTDIGSLARVPFEQVRPVRSAPSYKGQKNYTGPMVVRNNHQLDRVRILG